MFCKIKNNVAAPAKDFRAWGVSWAGFSRKPICWPYCNAVPKSTLAPLLERSCKLRVFECAVLSIVITRKAL